MYTDRRGFSTVLAILLTAFLVVVTSGALFLFLSENRINRALFDGFSSYAAAEAGMEYALLKIKNHREGFEDGLSRESAEGKILVSSIPTRNASASYILSSFSRVYSGTIAPGGIEIIPLFFDKGRVLKANPDLPLPFKNPNPESSEIEQTSDFLLDSESNFSWNIIGSDSMGTTFGITGTGGMLSKVWNASSAEITSGIFRKDGVQEISYESRTIGDFLSSYSDKYLFITNPGDASISYVLHSSNGFSKPGFKISASGKAGSSVSHLDFSEDRGRQFDALKYSIFNGGDEASEGR